MISNILFFFSGIAALFVVKYGIFGLTLWDDIFHKGRIEPPNLKRFMKPLLSGFYSGRDINPWPK